MTIGTVIPDRLPKKLNTPPVRPISRWGAMADTNDQVIDARPLPKKASARNPTIAAGSLTKFAPTMLVESRRPTTIGTLRAVPSEAPRRTIRSDKTPELSTPTNAARNGSDARNPAFTKLMPRACTRYVGNQVRKNQSVEVSANWPRYTPQSLRELSTCARS